MSSYFRFVCAQQCARTNPSPSRASTSYTAKPSTTTVPRSSHGGRATSSQQPQQLRRGVDVQVFNAQTVRGHDDDRRRAARPHRWPGDLHLVKPRALLRRTPPAIEAPRRHTERRGDITPSVALSLPLPTGPQPPAAGVCSSTAVARCRGRDSPAQRPSGTERVPDPSAPPRALELWTTRSRLTRRGRARTYAWLCQLERLPQPVRRGRFPAKWI